MNLAQWKNAEDAQARRAPPEPAPADGQRQRQRSASDPDEDPNPYPVYPVPRREHQEEPRTRPRDRSSGLFKWKRGGHVLDGARRPLVGGDEEELSEEGLVAREIAGFCHAKAQPDDWRQAHALGDMIHASESNSKEAVRTLRHEMRGSDTNAQRRAVRAWALWSLSSGGTFGSYACNTQLLSTLEELLENSLTFRELREDILDVLSALTFRRLRPVARLWARVRPDDRPAAGAPMREALFGGSPELVPEAAERPRPRDAPRAMERADVAARPVARQDRPERLVPRQDLPERLVPCPEVAERPRPHLESVPAWAERVQQEARASPRAELPIPPLEAQLGDLSLRRAAERPAKPRERFETFVPEDVPLKNPFLPPQPPSAADTYLPEEPLEARSSVETHPSHDAPPLPQRSPWRDVPPLPAVVPPSLPERRESAVDESADEPARDPAEIVADIYHSCQEAQANASVLSEALSYEGLAAPLAGEFADKVQASQDYLLAMLPWATEHAETPHAPELATGAEALLADVLDALSNAGDALAQRDRLSDAAAAHTEPPAPAVRVDEADDVPDPAQPSEKALGKRRAVDNESVAGSAEGGTDASAPLSSTSPSLPESRAAQKPPLPLIPAPCTPPHTDDEHVPGEWVASEPDTGNESEHTT